MWVPIVCSHQFNGSHSLEHFRHVKHLTILCFPIRKIPIIIVVRAEAQVQPRKPGTSGVAAKFVWIRWKNFKKLPISQRNVLVQVDSCYFEQIGFILLFLWTIINHRYIDQLCSYFNQTRSSCVKLKRSQRACTDLGLAYPQYSLRFQINSKEDGASVR